MKWDVIRVLLFLLATIAWGFEAISIGFFDANMNRELVAISYGLVALLYIPFLVVNLVKVVNYRGQKNKG